MSITIPLEGFGGGSGGLSMELLWENARPEDTFYAQTISLDLDGYSMFLFYYVYSTSLGYMKTEQAKNNNYVPYLSFPEFGGGTIMRAVYFEDIGIRFESAAFNGQANNTFCIPYRIYGIKGVSE